MWLSYLFIYLFYLWCLFPGDGLNSNSHLFIPLYFFCACSNSLILLSSLLLTYCSTLSSPITHTTALFPLPSHWRSSSCTDYMYCTHILLLVISPSTILSLWPYPLVILHLFPSTTPNVIPSPLLSIPNLLYLHTLITFDVHSLYSTDTFEVTQCNCLFFVLHPSFTCMFICHYNYFITQSLSTFNLQLTLLFSYFCHILSYDPWKLHKLSSFMLKFLNCHPEWQTNINDP